MRTFYNTLEYLDKVIYRPNKLIIVSSEEEKQNTEYAAGKFELLKESTIKTIRFRVAKKTPNKVGQFVTFWEKTSKGINQPFQYDEAPDLTVVTIFKDNNTLGQFVFPKDILLRKNILKSISTKGKMAMRVYPSWDKVANKTAAQTQCWQLDYYFELTAINRLPQKRILELYNR